jgi:hypothetical protein
MAFSLYAYYAAPGTALGYELRYGKEDWPAAAEYVRALEPDAVIIAPAYIRIPFERYWKDAGLKASATMPEKPVAFYYGVVGSGGVPHVTARRVILVLSHAGPMEEGLPAGLARNRRLIDEKFFLHHSGIRVFVYDALSKEKGNGDVRK